MLESLSAGLFGASFRATLRLYLTGIGLIGLSAIGVGLGYGMKAVFTVTPALVFSLVALQYLAYLYGSCFRESNKPLFPEARNRVSLSLLLALNAVVIALTVKVGVIYIISLSKLGSPERLDNVGDIVTAILGVVSSLGILYNRLFFKKKKADQGRLREQPEQERKVDG
jgi:hypothetical protein